MKFLNRVQIVGKRIIEKILKVDNVEKLQAQEEKMTNVLNISKGQLNDIKAEIRVSEKENEARKKELKKLLNLCKTKKDTLSDKELQDIYRLYEKQENEIKNAETAIELNKKLLAQCETQVNIYNNRIAEISKNVSVLKIKNDYAENVKKFKDIAKDLKVKDAKDLAREIEVNFTSAEFDLEDMKTEDLTIEKVLNEASNEEGFKEFMKKVNE